MEPGSGKLKKLMTVQLPPKLKALSMNKIGDCKWLREEKSKWGRGERTKRKLFIEE